MKETDHKFKKPCPAQQQQKTTKTSPCLNHLTSYHMHKQMPSTYNFSPAACDGGSLRRQDNTAHIVPFASQPPTTHRNNDPSTARNMNPPKRREHDSVTDGYLLPAVLFLLLDCCSPQPAFQYARLLVKLLTIWTPSPSFPPTFKMTDSSTGGFPELVRLRTCFSLAARFETIDLASS